MRYGPALCRPIAVVRNELREVFYECDEQLDVGDDIDLQLFRSVSGIICRGESTDYVNPGPAILLRLVIMLQIHNESGPSDYKATSDEYQHNSLANSRLTICPLVEAPHHREVLGEGDRAEDHGMSGKRNIIGLHSGREAMVPQRILLAYMRRIQEGHVRNEVRNETQDVYRGEVDGGPACRFAAEVDDRLRVERE